MTSIRMSLFTMVFAVLGACTQIEGPAPPGGDEVGSSQSDLQSPAVLPSSLQSCLLHCGPDDLGCIDCCRCLAHGGTAPMCCE